MSKKRKVIDVYGIVQGVGFRPFVYNLAIKNSLTGYVNNNSNGVIIDIQGEEDNLKAFIVELSKNPPLLSKIKKVKITEKKVNQKYTDFYIKLTEKNISPTTYISPDYSICDKCKTEIFDKNNKRYRYPFTNCTCCGPRFSIIKDLPYDRDLTTMNEFEMCESCKAEYNNPENRRFHAQPNVCPECGPIVFLSKSNGELIKYEDPLTETIKLIKEGNIIAVKGLGGFNLSCDAKNEETIRLLRKRKKRPQKPFAVMMRDLEVVKKYCNLSKEEEAVLLSNKRPIVLLEKNKNYGLPNNLAPNNKRVGVMLPYTPLHYLLFDENTEILVMTSGNISGEPIIYKNNQALEKLNNIADYYLLNNRGIYMSIDDSVTRVIKNRERVIRSARGYSPKSIFMNTKSEILALGSELKNTISVSNKNDVFMSEYIGDLKNIETTNKFERVISHYLKIYSIKPKIIVYDMHPSFVYRDINLKDILNINEDVKIMETQHHHSHVVSCMVENDINEQVIGIAYDGTGYGDDKKIWGGEFLLCNRKEYVRIGHLQYFNLPGGESAIKNPWKIALSLLYKVYNDDFINYIPNNLKNKSVSVIKNIIDKKINSPETSSIGRLFDGISALIGLIEEISFEGEAAIILENISNEEIINNYKYNIDKIEDRYIIKFNEIIIGIVNDIRNKVTKDIISAKFHNTVVEFTIDMAKRMREKTKVNKVILTGGVFQNEILLDRTIVKLIENNFEVITHTIIPCNDSGISLGQLAIANEKIN